MGSVCFPKGSVSVAVVTDWPCSDGEERGGFTGYSSNPGVPLVPGGGPYSKLGAVACWYAS